jgi:VWFA-related protein
MGGGLIFMRRLWILLAVAVPLLAETPPAIRVDVNLVRVPCVVTQADGAPVHGLRKDDSAILENGVRQEVKYVWQEVDLPLSVVMVVETCGQQESTKLYTEAMLQLLGRVMAKNDQAGIVSALARRGSLSTFTDSLDRLRDGAVNIGRPGPVLGYECSGRHPTF